MDAHDVDSASRTASSVMSLKLQTVAGELITAANNANT
jgi:hypothetical protein